MKIIKNIRGKNKEVHICLINNEVVSIKARAAAIFFLLKYTITTANIPTIYKIIEIASSKLLEVSEIEPYVLDNTLKFTKK